LIVRLVEDYKEREKKIPVLIMAKISRRELLRTGADVKSEMARGEKEGPVSLRERGLFKAS
jgi:hypothetical protein